MFCVAGSVSKQSVLRYTTKPVTKGFSGSPMTLQWMVRVSGVLYSTEHHSGGLMPCRQYRVRAGGVAVTEYEIDMTSLDNINQ